MKNYDEFERGYRKGVLFALVSLLNMSKEIKLKEDKLLIPIRIYIQALIDKLDLFLDFGDNLIFAYSEHDKKKVPQKAEVFRNKRHWMANQIARERFKRQKEVNNDR
jgi:hypothetical protein